jgi:uncharacterized protein YdeI (YjbR/CyaY-like superfamily)
MADRPADGEDIAHFADAAAWDAWLAEHHDRSAGVWLRIAKKGSRHSSITISDALEVALCHGWIDSRRKGLDADHYLQRYSPRRATSSWSQVNVARVEALLAASRMRAGGLAAIEAAKADGRWDAAYERQREATIPDDLAAALAADDAARQNFEQLDRTARYAVFLRLMKARAPAARARQLEQVIASLH